MVGKRSVSVDAEWLVEESVVVGVYEEGEAEQSVNEVVEVAEPREKEEELVIVMESAPPFPPMHLH